MIENYAPGLSGPALPKGCHGWQFWQFSGDKFYLPGVKGAIDLNYFNGSEAELHAFVDRQQVAATVVTLEERLLRLEEAARLRGWML
jgi:GH25 family lysozyme M1 (1,4-beta-N-acetylmuramidase)